jgi:hypothetical protein
MKKASEIASVSKYYEKEAHKGVEVHTPAALPSGEGSPSVPRAGMDRAVATRYTSASPHGR